MRLPRTHPLPLGHTGPSGLRGTSGRRAGKLIGDRIANVRAVISRRAFVAGSLASPALSQKTPGPIARATARLVVAPATVTDSGHKLVRNLAAEDFALFEEGVPRDIEVDQEAMPVSLVIAAQATNAARKPLARLRENGKPVRPAGGGRRRGRRRWSLSAMT